MFWGAGKYTSVEIAAYNQLHIIPFNKHIRDECSPEMGCRRIRENSLHPFNQLSDEDLETMAHANAALLIAERVRNDSMAIWKKCGSKHLSTIPRYKKAD